MVSRELKRRYQQSVLDGVESEPYSAYQLGRSHKEREKMNLQSKILVCLMDNGQMKAKEIARELRTKKGNIHSTCYILKKKGLINTNMQGYYLTTDGEQYIKENASKFLDRGNVIEKITKHGDNYCPNYNNQTVLRDEQGRCSLCEAEIIEPEPIQKAPEPSTSEDNMKNDEVGDTHTVRKLEGLASVFWRDKYFELLNKYETLALTIAKRGE
jgi:predicted DNA-binding transcriptional regulator